MNSSGKLVDAEAKGDEKDHSAGARNYEGLLKETHGMTRDSSEDHDRCTATWSAATTLHC